MVRKKGKAEEDVDALWEEYRRIQLTPEQKAELRARAEQAAEKARRDGVYERVLGLIGNLHLDEEDLREVRRDDD